MFRIQFYIRCANKKFWSTTFLRRGRVCESLTRNIPRHHEWQLEINDSWDFPKWKFINPSGLSPLPNIFLICQHIFHPFLLILSLFYMKYSSKRTGNKRRKIISKKYFFRSVGMYKSWKISRFLQKCYLIKVISNLFLHNNQFSKKQNLKIELKYVCEVCSQTNMHIQFKIIDLPLSLSISKPN